MQLPVLWLLVERNAAERTFSYRSRRFMPGQRVLAVPHSSGAPLFLVESWTNPFLARQKQICQPTTQISPLFLRRPSSKVELLAVQHGAKAWLAIPPPHQHMRTTQARH